MSLARSNDYSNSRATRTVAATVLITLSLVSIARAQSDAVGSLRGGSGDSGLGAGGVRVSETAYLRLRVTAEAGYDSNVFFNDQQKVDAPTLVVTPSFQLTNDSRSGEHPPLRYGVGAALVYREYLSGEDTTRSQRAFNPTFNALLGYSPSSSFGITIVDQFARLEDPPYAPGVGAIERTYNNAIADIRITPGGGRLQSSFRYSNMLEMFQMGNASFADRMGHDFSLGAAWKWLPKTAVFLEAGVGYVHYLNTAARTQGKVDSVPYRALAGLKGLVTPKVTVNLGAGYADAIYDDSAADPTGTSNLVAHATATYNFTLTSALGLGYQHKFVDSPFIGNFYDSDTAVVALNQQIAAFVLRAFYVYEYRNYQGFQAAVPVNRRDHVQGAGVQADYYIQRWFFAGARYAAEINRSNLGPGGRVAGTSSGDYTKHTVLGRLGLNY